MGFFSLCWNINDMGFYWGSRESYLRRRHLTENIADHLKWHMQAEIVSWKDWKGCTCCGQNPEQTRRVLHLMLTHQGKNFFLMIMKYDILFQKLKARSAKGLRKILAQEIHSCETFWWCSKLEAYGLIFPRNTLFHI